MPLYVVTQQTGHDSSSCMTRPTTTQAQVSLSLYAAYYASKSTGWRLHSGLAKRKAGGGLGCWRKQFDHERYRATRLSTRRLNERMAVDWLDRTQAGRNWMSPYVV